VLKDSAQYGRLFIITRRAAVSEIVLETAAATQKKACLFTGQYPPEIHSFRMLKVRALTLKVIYA